MEQLHPSPKFAADPGSPKTMGNNVFFPQRLLGCPAESDVRNDRDRNRWFISPI